MIISSSGCNIEEVQKAIDEFFTRYLPSWIEVLIIMRNLGVGVHAINEIRQWYNSVSYEGFFLLPNSILIINPGRLDLQMGR